MTLKTHHAERMKRARNSMHRIRRLAEQMGMCPEACKRAFVVCVQAPALYGVELWWDDGKARKSRTGQKLQNEGGRTTTGELPDHQSGGRDGPTEQQKPTTCAEANVTTEGQPGQVTAGL